jgi:hypothetical protein
MSMSQAEVPGGQLIFADNKRIERKIVIGTTVNPPGGAGALAVSEQTDLPGGLKRGSYEYVQFGNFGADGGNQTSPTDQIELIGGSREVPIQTHPKFSEISDEDIAAITAAAEQSDDSLLPDDMAGNKQTLYNLLRSKVTHFLAPAVTARSISVQSALPDLGGLLKISQPPGVSAGPLGSTWVQTGVSARGFGTSFEVSREYTLIGDGRQFASFLYS